MFGVREIQSVVPFTARGLLHKKDRTNFVTFFVRTNFRISYDIFINIWYEIFSSYANSLRTNDSAKFSAKKKDQIGPPILIRANSIFKAVNTKDIAIKKHFIVFFHHKQSKELSESRAKSRLLLALGGNTFRIVMLHLRDLIINSPFQDRALFQNTN